MANTKEYKIVINGLTESINAVDALNKQLDALSKKIDALSSKSVNVGSKTSTTSSTGGKSSKSTLTEEEKLARQIEQIDKRREAYSKKIYQNYLAAKDVLKETENDQKQIAAQERLQADNYTNTMQGLKQKLADIKNVMQTTDIGEDIFKKYTKEANEITNKLKELEQAYGQFGRNVGNYASAADGFNKIKVAVGDTVREYDNYKQAVKDLKSERFQLSQTIGTEAKAYKDVDVALKKLESDYADLNKSSAFMDNLLDTMQSFTSIAGIGVGLTQLFGIDDSEFQESMKRLTALLVVLKSIESLKLQWDKDEGWLIKPFKELWGYIDRFGEKIQSLFQWPIANYASKLTEKFYDKYEKEFYDIGVDAAEEWLRGYDESLVSGLDSLTADEKFNEIFNAFTSMKAWDEASKKAGKFFTFLKTGIKGVGKVLFATITLGLSLLLPEIIEGVTNFVKSLNTSKEIADAAAQSVKALTRQFENLNEELASSYLKGEIDDMEYLNSLYTKQAALIAREIELLEDRSKAIQKNGVLGTSFLSTKNTEFSGKEFEPTTVGAGNLRIFGNDLHVTVESIEEVEEVWEKCVESVRQGKDLFETALGGIRGWFGSLVVTVKDTENVMRGMGNIRLSDFISQFGELNRQFKNTEISAEEYAEGLKKLKNEMNDNKVLNSVIANLDKYIPDEKVREAVQNIINEIQRLDDAFNMTSEGQIHYWNQVRIDAMKEGAEKTMAQIKENERHEIFEQGKTEEQINLIHAKYQRQRLDAQEKYNKEALDKAKAAGEKLKAAENELIALRIENMKEGLNKRLAELDNERRLALQKARENGIKVGELEIEINKKYDQKIIEEKRQWAFEVIKTYEDLASKIVQINKATFEKEVSTASQNIERKQNQKELETGYSMITPTSYDDSKNLEAYYRKIIEIRKNAIEKEAQVEQEGLDKQLEISKQEEELRHKRAIDQNNGEFIQQLRNGKITQEQYDKLIEDENDAHYARMNALDKEYASNSEKVTAESLENQRKLYSDFYGNIVNDLRRDKSKIDEVLSKQPVVDNAGWDVVNIGKTSSNYKKAISDYDNLKKEIVKKQQELVADLQAGRVKPEDFALRKEELDNELKGIDQSIQDVVDRQKSLMAEFMQSLTPYIQAIANSFNQIMDAVWSAQDTAFDKEQEALDKYTDELAEALNKQEDLYEQHKSAIESIEDELATSRGDRRQHLIDQLNAEMEAEKAAAAEKKRIEKEQEAAQKKQDELDKKRKKAEYDRQILQAIVNGAMAVTMAAINKWPIPAVPLMALAASTTAAQVAIMKANKPYRVGGQLDGGLVTGKRHTQGGVPVGNTGIEVEGSEYIIRRESTAPNLNLLDFINNSQKKLDLSDFIEFYSDKPKRVISGIQKKMYADGGYLPTLPTQLDIKDQLRDVYIMQDRTPIVVSVVDILNKQEQLRNVKVLAGLSE